MRFANKKLFFPAYRKRGIFYLVYQMIRYCMFFQLLFYSVMGNYFFLGSMDHLMSRTAICSATNKDSINISRCTALGDVIRFNSGSWFIALYLLCLSYATVLQNEDWDYTSMPDENLVYSLLFAGPAALMAVFALVVPLILNPYVLGWPFNPPLCRRRVVKSEKAAKTHRRGSNGARVVDLRTFMTTDAAQELGKEIGRVQNRPDVELGSLATNEFGAGSKYPMSVAGGPVNKGASLLRSTDQLRAHEIRMAALAKAAAYERRTATGGGHRKPQSNPGTTSGSKQRVKLAMI
jgi:hypothetical protein